MLLKELFLTEFSKEDTARAEVHTLRANVASGEVAQAKTKLNIFSAHKKAAALHSSAAIHHRKAKNIDQALAHERAYDYHQKKSIEAR